MNRIIDVDRTVYFACSSKEHTEKGTLNMIKEIPLPCCLPYQFYPLLPAVCSLVYIVVGDVKGKK